MGDNRSNSADSRAHLRRPRRWHGSRYPTWSANRCCVGHRSAGSGTLPSATELHGGRRMTAARRVGDGDEPEDLIGGARRRVGGRRQEAVDVGRRSTPVTDAGAARQRRLTRPAPELRSGSDPGATAEPCRGGRVSVARSPGVRDGRGDRYRPVLPGQDLRPAPLYPVGVDGGQASSRVTGSSSPADPAPSRAERGHRRFADPGWLAPPGSIRESRDHRQCRPLRSDFVGLLPNSSEGHLIKASSGRQATQVACCDTSSGI